MKVSEIKVKTILSKLRESDSLFGNQYSMNVYRGCSHSCIYCDSRSDCYQLGSLDDIRIKVNAPELLAKALSSLKTKGTIGTGSMNDPYMPVENKYELTKKCLEIINHYQFPVHVMTKSNLVCRDIEILKQISKVYAAVSITITSFDDNLSKIIEPNAPPSTERFNAIKSLSDAGIYCGISLMPILPYINDTEENLYEILRRAKESGAKYILPIFGLTQRKGQKEYFHEKLREINANLPKMYQKQFGDKYYCPSPNYQSLEKFFMDSAKKIGIPLFMNHYKGVSKPTQLDLF